jgi:hypothetical protein
MIVRMYPVLLRFDRRARVTFKIECAVRTKDLVAKSLVTSVSILIQYEN